MSELNKEFDLVGKAKQLTSTAADLSDKAIDAVDEANTKYDFVKVVKDSTNKAIDAVREKSNKSSEWSYLSRTLSMSYVAQVLHSGSYNTKNLTPPHASCPFFFFHQIL